MLVIIMKKVYRIKYFFVIKYIYNDKDTAQHPVVIGANGEGGEKPVVAAPEIDRSMLVADDWDGFAQRLTVKENIFYAPEVSRFDFGESVQTTLEGNYYMGKYSQLPDEKGIRTLAPAFAEVIENEGTDGLMQLMDSVTVAGGVQCVFVSKEKIEAFFNQVYAQ